MGWNQGYEVMEATVIAAYDAGGLTPSLLNAILEPYRNTDCDHGGSRDLRTKDGKSADDVILFILLPEKYARLCRIKAALEDAGITGMSLWGLGDIPRGAKTHRLYGGGLLVRDRRHHRGFRREETKDQALEYQFGQTWMWDYEDCYSDALKQVTQWW